MLRGTWQSCREPNCCIGAGSVNTCAANFFQGQALGRKRTVSMAAATNKSDLIMTAEEEQNCKKSYKANRMNFTDADGKEYSIHMPAERFEEAIALFVKSDWDALKKFPAWADQKYEDYEITIVE